MFNNVALDAVIGIVLVYLLYSMLVTLIGEFVSAKLGLRARVLRTAIERMLNDGYYQQKAPWWNPLPFLHNWISDGFLYERKAFKGSFAGRFYQYPSIKFLGKVSAEFKMPFTLTKPAYISADYFADTLINLLKDKSRGLADIDRITFTLEYNTQHIQPDTLKNIRNIFLASDGDMGKFKSGLIKWYKETTDRSTGWYKRKLQFVLFLLGLLVASLFNVDSVKIAGILSKDKEARSQLVNMGIQLAKDTTKYKDLTARKKDSVMHKAVIDSGLNHVSKDIGSANAILGIGWVYDTLKTRDQFEVNQKDTLFRLALAVAGRLNQLRADLKINETAFLKEKLRLDSCKKAQAILPTDAYLVGQDLLRAKARQQADARDASKEKADLLRVNELMAASDTLIAHSLALSNLIGQLPPKIKRDSFYVAQALASIKLMQQPFLREGYLQIYQVSQPYTGKKGSEIRISGLRKYDLWETVKQYLVNTRDNFWGLLVTALALSMGAPFWFNLLEKLVAIRSSGPNPDKKKPDPATGGGDTPDDAKDPATAVTGGVPGPAPAVAALNAFTDKLAQEQGIVSIWLNKNPLSFSVRVISDDIMKQLVGKYGKTYKGADGTSYAVGYNTTDINVLHGSACGGRIANFSRSLGSGTLGAYLKKGSDDAIYFISCWHVMKDDTNWKVFPTGDNQSIVDAGDNKKQLIGTIVEGGLTPNYDVGIAQNILSGFTANNSPTANFQILKQHRALTDFDDSVSTGVKILGFASGYKEAKIYRTQVNASLPYHDGKNHMMYDVFSMTVTNPDNTIGKAPTDEGDSGSVVIDGDGAPLGMIIGGNAHFSYAIKFSNIFDKGEPYHGYSFIIPVNNPDHVNT